AEDGIRDLTVTGVQTCALPIYSRHTIRIHILDPHHLLKSKSSMSSPDPAGLHSSMWRFADPEARYRIIHHYRPRVNTPRQRVSEIGRASCRERVKIAVVAVSVK